MRRLWRTTKGTSSMSTVTDAMTKTDTTNLSLWTPTKPATNWCEELPGAGRSGCAWLAS
jgi:hypothetical protein